MQTTVQRTTPYRVLALALLMALVVFFAFPLFWIITGSFKSAKVINSRTPQWFPLELLNTGEPGWAAFLPTVGWPFGVFLMKQFAENIPGSILEATRIDGAGEIQTFIQIVLPMVAPGIGALAIFTFISTWNDYFLQLLMLNTERTMTISVGIAKLQQEMSTDFGLIMAGAAIAAIPIVLIFLIFQRFFTRGITIGAVKG